jgi:hypothetical protein
MTVFMMTPSVAKKMMALPVVKYVERDIEVKMIAPVLPRRPSGLFQSCSSDRN